MSDSLGASRRLNPARREGERVTFLELFFDLVFVLAVTQCTALMAASPTWEGLAKGLLVLAAIWWAWVGYAWLTSVVDPEAGPVRLVIFLAMGAMLVCALCIPEVFEDLGLTFAVAYGVVRAAHIALFVLASRGERIFRRAVIGLGVGTATGVGLITVASQLDGTAQGAVWMLAIALDMVEPFLFGAAGWHLVSGHFAERHGLIVILALGESIVAIGLGATGGVDAGVLVAASLGVTVAGALWWAYFDVVAPLAGWHLSEAEAGREQNEMARDGYSYLHLPIVAGIVLVALGLETTIAHAGEPLDTVPGVALFGGAALFVVGNVAFKWRTLEKVSGTRSVAAGLLVVAIAVAPHVDAAVALALTAVILWGLAAVETHLNVHDRDLVRRKVATSRVPAE